MKKHFIFNMMTAVLLISTLFITCTDIPKGVTAVQNFKKDKYLGKWYEIARFDYRFEKDLDNVSAEYSLNKDGSIKVFNKGFNTQKQIWKSATGKAKFVGAENQARLKVSFFGPFYAGYNVADIDNDYQNALVYGNNTDYIWILSRTKTIDDVTKKRFLEKAQKDGYDTSKLIWVKHNKN